MLTQISACGCCGRTVEPEINVEADIDISEIADIAEGAEEAAELIAALL